MQHINTLLDPVVNFGKVTVSTGYTSTATEVTLITGDGSKLPNPVPSGSFNLVWFNNSTYSDPADDPYVEIVRCIARVGDVLTLMRAQEGTVASNKNISAKIYKMILSPTKKTIDDIGVESQSKIDTHSLITSNVHNFDSSGNAPAQTHGISRHTGTIGTWSDIDKTISSISDITTRSHTLLTDIGTNTHAIIDTAILNSTTHISASIAHNTSSNIVGISDTQTLTNKTLTSPFISTIYGGNVANDDITIEGTSHATKTSSYVILQPTSGNVGIGAMNPVSLNGRATVLQIGTTSTGLVLGHDDTNWELMTSGSVSTGAFSIAKGTNIRMHIDHNGNVGIGTTSPTATLQIASEGIFEGNVAGLTGLVIQKQGTNDRTTVGITSKGTGQYADLALFHGSDYTTNFEQYRLGYDGSGNYFYLATSKGGTGTLRPLVLDATGVGSNLYKQLYLAISGNVGIGMASPATSLDIMMSAGADMNDTITLGTNTVGIIVRHPSDTTGYGNGLWFEQSGLPSGIGSTRVSSGNWGTDLRFYTHPTAIINQLVLSERMRINSEGNVGIGTTNPTAKLHIGGTPGTDGIKFPDGTLQTTAASAGTGITLSTPIATNLGSETNIRDDNFGTRSSNQSTYSVNNQTFYATYDLGSEKTVMATAEIYGISAYDGGGDIGYANCSIQGSHNNSSWYTFGPSSGNVGVGGIACVGAVLSCRYIKVALFIHACNSSGIGQFTAGINEFKVR